MTTHARPRSSMTAIIVCVMLLAATAVALPHIGQLPMTRHAKRSHKREMVNAERMVGLIVANTCKDMRVYYCPKEHTWKVLCRITPNAVGGLVIGNRGLEPVIITGYAGSDDYWKDNLAACHETDRLPFALP